MDFVFGGQVKGGDELEEKEGQEVDADAIKILIWGDSKGKDGLLKPILQSLNLDPQEGEGFFKHIIDKTLEELDEDGFFEGDDDVYNRDESNLNPKLPKVRQRDVREAIKQSFANTYAITGIAWLKKETMYSYSYQIFEKYIKWEEGNYADAGVLKCHAYFNVKHLAARVKGFQRHVPKKGAEKGPGNHRRVMTVKNLKKFLREEIGVQVSTEQAIRLVLKYKAEWQALVYASGKLPDKLKVKTDETTVGEKANEEESDKEENRTERCLNLFEFLLFYKIEIATRVRKLSLLVDHLMGGIRQVGSQEQENKSDAAKIVSIFERSLSAGSDNTKFRSQGAQPPGSGVKSTTPEAAAQAVQRAFPEYALCTLCNKQVNYLEAHVKYYQKLWKEHNMEEAQRIMDQEIFKPLLREDFISDMLSAEIREDINLFESPRAKELYDGKDERYKRTGKNGIRRVVVACEKAAFQVSESYLTNEQSNHAVPVLRDPHTYEVREIIQRMPLGAWLCYEHFVKIAGNPVRAAIAAAGEYIQLASANLLKPMAQELFQDASDVLSKLAASILESEDAMMMLSTGLLSGVDSAQGNIAFSHDVDKKRRQELNLILDGPVSPTTLQLAIESENKQFISQRQVEDFIEDSWAGSIPGLMVKSDKMEGEYFVYEDEKVYQKINSQRLALDTFCRDFGNLTKFGPGSIEGLPGDGQQTNWEDKIKKREELKEIDRDFSMRDALPLKDIGTSKDFQFFEACPPNGGETHHLYGSGNSYYDGCQKIILETIIDEKSIAMTPENLEYPKQGDGSPAAWELSCGVFLEDAGLVIVLPCTDRQARQEIQGKPGARQKEEIKAMAVVFIPNDKFPAKQITAHRKREAVETSMILRGNVHVDRKKILGDDKADKEGERFKRIRDKGQNFPLEDKFNDRGEDKKIMRPIGFSKYTADGRTVLYRTKDQPESWTPLEEYYQSLFGTEQLADTVLMESKPPVQDRNAGDIVTDRQLEVPWKKMEDYRRILRRRFAQFIEPTRVLKLRRVRYFIEFAWFMIYLTVLHFQVFANSRPSGALATAERVLLWFWVGYTVQEIGEISESARQSEGTAFANHFTSFWNVLDVSSMLVFLVYFLMRFAEMSGALTWGLSQYSNQVLAVNCLLLWLRVLHVTASFKQLGPNLRIVYLMIYQILYFIFQYVIFLLGFAGLAAAWFTSHEAYRFELGEDDGSESIYACNDVDASCRYWTTVQMLVLASIGEFGLRSNMNAVIEVYPNSGWFVMFFWIMLSLVLLFNLLIAILSSTYETIADRSKEEYIFGKGQVFVKYRFEPTDNVELMFPFRALLTPIYTPLYWITYRFVNYDMSIYKRYCNSLHLITNQFLTTILTCPFYLIIEALLLLPEVGYTLVHGIFAATDYGTKMATKCICVDDPTTVKNPMLYYLLSFMCTLLWLVALPICVIVLLFSVPILVVYDACTASIMVIRFTYLTRTYQLSTDNPEFTLEAWEDACFNGKTRDFERLCKDKQRDFDKAQATEGSDDRALRHSTGSKYSGAATSLWSLMKKITDTYKGDQSSQTVDSNKEKSGGNTLIRESIRELVPEIERIHNMSTVSHHNIVAQLQTSQDQEFSRTQTRIRELENSQAQQFSEFKDSVLKGTSGKLEHLIEQITKLSENQVELQKNIEDVTKKQSKMETALGEDLELQKKLSENEKQQTKKLGQFFSKDSTKSTSTSTSTFSNLFGFGTSALALTANPVAPDQRGSSTGPNENCTWLEDQAEGEPEEKGDQAEGEPVEKEEEEGE